jgi:chromosome segregation ATPase
MGCGLSAGKSVISEINMMEGENHDKQTFVTQVDQKLFSLIQIQSKRYDILGLAAGSKDGFVQLYPSPFSQYSDIDPWESVKSHRSTVTNIAYSRDTNLLFSTGEDGNLFIYCIYELPDGETISFEDNKINNFNQLTSILDEGLGDNVLYPLESIFNYEEEILLQNNLIADDKKLRGKLVSEHQTKLKELETKLSKQKEMELRSLEEKLKELKISKDATIDHYEDKIKNLINEQNRTLIEKEQSYNLRMDQMSNTIHDLTSQIHFLKNQHEIELKRKDDEYERKFRELEKDLRKKFEELKSNNDKLGEELNQRQRIEELKFLHLDQEHEQEISYKIEHYENLLAHEKKTIIESQNEISLLKDQKTKLEQEKVEQENENKKLAEEIERLTVSTHNLKNIIDKKDKDNDELKKKLQKSEGALQEKTILSGFSSKLKNELYKKNTEILSGYNRQQIDIGELKVNSKNTEKELEESMKLLENYEKELTKQRILIDELKNKCDDERKFARSKESDFDNLLNKIYETFQSNDKNKIIIGIRKIYTNYLTDEKMRKIESGRMNQNIRDELEKQIDFLQKSLISTIDIKGKRETIQHSEINKRTEHNSLLIEELNKNKKNYTILEKDYRKLKSDFSAMEKRQEKYLKMENDGIIPTSNKSPTVYYLFLF